jgi:nucleotide-binding universal stress UspA family protein
MKMLVPTDFSKTSEKARLLALDLAERLGGTVDIIHVQEHFETTPGYVSLHSRVDGVNDDLMRRLQEHYQQEVKDHMDLLATLTPRGGEYELLWGQAVKAILEASANYDLVLMGAHGANRFDNFFLGGVAGRVVRHSTVPVLTVRDEATTTGIKRLLFATDFGEASKQAWHWCRPLREAGIKTVAVNVIDDWRLQSEQGYIKTVADALSYLCEGQTEQQLIREGNPLEVLPTIAKEVAADAIVIGLHRHTNMAGLFLGSRADALLRSSPVPILSVPFVKD